MINIGKVWFNVWMSYSIWQMFLGCKEIITIGWDIGDISKFSGDNQNEEQ